jgi:hypothetical protein
MDKQPFHVERLHGTVCDTWYFKNGIKVITVRIFDIIIEQIGSGEIGGLV